MMAFAASGSHTVTLSAMGDYVGNRFFYERDDVLAIIFSDGIVRNLPVYDPDVFSENIAEAQAAFSSAGDAARISRVGDNDGWLAAWIGYFEIIVNQRR